MHMNSEGQADTPEYAGRRDTLPDPSRPSRPPLASSAFNSGSPAPRPVRIPLAPSMLKSGLAPVRLGVIDYLNVMPVYDWLLECERAGEGLARVVTVAGVPSQMNAALLVGEI